MINIPKIVAYCSLIVLVSLAVIPTLYFLDRFNDTVLIRQYWEYTIVSFGIFDVIKLWAISFLGAVLFISIIKFFWFLLIKASNYKFIELIIYYFIDGCYRLIKVVNSSYLKIFIISIITSTVFLFIDIPNSFNKDLNVFYNLLPKQTTILYKNEHLNKHVVEQIQNSLVDSGYQLQVDGIYGKNTQNKVVEELSKNELEISEDNLDYAGMYLLRAQQQDGLLNTRLLKESLMLILKVIIYTFFTLIIILNFKFTVRI